MDETTDTSPEPISPELVLVTPELRAAACAALPPPGYPFWRDRPDAAPVPPAGGEWLYNPSPASRRPQLVAAARWVGARVLPPAIIFAAAVVIAIVLFLVGSNHGPSLPGGTSLASGGTSVGTLAPATIRLTWARVKGARFYDAQVFRGTTRVYEAWPIGPALRLPLADLAAGTYVLYVWPIFAHQGFSTYGGLLARVSFGIGEPPAPPATTGTNAAG